MRRIALINEKGGTGKTTLAVNVAAYFAQQKHLPVLLVDLDTQGHAAKSLGIDVRGLPAHVFHLLTDPAVRLEQVIYPTAVPNLSVLPSYKQMADFPTWVADDAQRSRLLERRLQQPAASRFEVVLFDAPPSLGLATRNILVAATEVVIPVSLTYLALDGCAELVETIRQVTAEEHCAPLPVSLVVPTFYRNTALADQILEKLRLYFPGALSREPLAFNVKIDEAQSHGKTIWEYAPSSRGAKMLQIISEEIWAAAPAAVLGADAHAAEAGAA